MALIYADDFKQLKYANVKLTTGWVGFTVADAYAVNAGIEAMGFYRPVAHRIQIGTAGDDPNYATYNSVGYWIDAGYDCLTLFNYGTTGYAGTGSFPDGVVNGLKRDVKQEGDTLFINITWAFPPDFRFKPTIVGTPFMKFGDEYTLTITANQTIAFNGEDTGFAAFYDTDFKLITEVVFGPDYMELWVGSERLTRQTRKAVQVKHYTIGFENFDGLGSTPKPSWIMKIYGIIVADSSEGAINSRIGRKIVRTYEATAVTSTATLQTYQSTTPLDTIRRPAQDLLLDTGLPVYGNYYSPNPFVKTTVTGAKEAGSIPLAACVHTQAKRRVPAGDGLSVLPFLSISGTEYVADSVQDTRQRWTAKCTPINIPEGMQFTAFSFGYTHDYPDVERLFIDDRSKVEVYGKAHDPYQFPTPIEAQLVNSGTHASRQLTFGPQQLWEGDDYFLLPSVVPAIAKLLPDLTIENTATVPGMTYPTMSNVSNPFIAVAATGGVASLSRNNGDSWETLVAGSTFLGRTVEFKGNIWVEAATLSWRKYTMDMASYETVAGNVRLGRNYWSLNKNCVVYASGASLMVGWDNPAMYVGMGSGFTDNMAVDYVGMNVFFIRNNDDNNKLVYVAPTQAGGVTVLASVSATYTGMLAMKNQLLLWETDVLSMSNYKMRADEHNATLQEATAMVNQLLNSTIGSNPHTVLNGSASGQYYLVPWRAHNRIVLGTRTQYQVWQLP